MWKIPLFDVNYDEQERQAVDAVLASGWLTMGPKTAEFEEAFSAYLGSNSHSLAVSSCTAALHLSLLAAGIRCGDEVIISGLSFVACLNVVTLVGATPVLADCQGLDDWNVSPESVEAKITARTKAIIVVHFAGYPCDIQRLCALAKKYQLLLIEDVAHAVGASVAGRKCGTFGDMACFSFFSNKNLSVGEGGMVVTRSPDLYEKLRLLRSHGMTSLTVDRHNQKSSSYDVLIPGFNYRLDEIHSALGLVQLRKLDEANRRRGDLVRHYRTRLLLHLELTVPWGTLPHNVVPAYHIFTVLLPSGVSRAAIMERLRIKGIQTSLHYPSYGDFSAYRSKLSGAVPITDEISRRVLTLPLFPGMSELMVDEVIDALLPVKE